MIEYADYEVGSLFVDFTIDKFEGELDVPDGIYIEIEKVCAIVDSEFLIYGSQTVELKDYDEEKIKEQIKHQLS